MKILIAITGASGMPYAAKLIETLKNLNLDYNGIISTPALKIFRKEAGNKTALLQKFYSDADMEAPFSSGSSSVDAMVIIPCSMKTLAAIAGGYASNLITRSADVMLKERKKLIIVPRETPLNSIHLEDMLKLSNMGAVILPAMPAFYHSPENIEDILNFIAGKVLDVLEIKNNLYRRWGE